METIGTANNRQILYCNTRKDENWHSFLPNGNWLAFTIVDEEDKDFLDNVVAECLNHRVCYTYGTGELCSLTDDYFDEEIVWREIQKEELTGEPADYSKTPMTDFSRNFSEGFWFAVTFAEATFDEVFIPINTIVCIDCTKSKVRKHLMELVEKINSGWLPPDDEDNTPKYQMVDKSALIPLLTASIQELSTLITAQQSTIQSLTERITELENK